MEVINKIELRLRYDEILKRIKGGEVFIHPTDTIYGLSCNALNVNAVKKIRRLKDRSESPFSIWAPSLEWIKTNCKTSKKDEASLKFLPGPYTIIVELKNKKAIVKEVIPKTNSLGIRIPDHWFNYIVAELGIPIVTTSVNKSGQPFMTVVEDIDPEIEAGVEFIIYEGEKKAKPSKIINLVDKKVVRE